MDGLRTSAEKVEPYFTSFADSRRLYIFAAELCCLLKS